MLCLQFERLAGGIYLSHCEHSSEFNNATKHKLASSKPCVLY